MKYQNYGPYPCDESDVPDYILPDPLSKPDGSKVSTAQEWMNFQRSVILDAFKKYEYGEVLPRPDFMRFELLDSKSNAFSGTAIRKEIRIHTGMNNGKNHSFDMLLYIPKDAPKPVPAFIGLNFKGNHNTTDEADVAQTGFIAPGVLAEKKRSMQIDRWCFREAVKRGYASATICYHDIYPDRINSTANSIFKLFFEPNEYPSISAKYSVVGAWAWGLSRALECLQAEPMINPDAIAVHGHSRLGKTALWAGAIEQHFAMVISNCSGCCGGALHRRKFGENLSQHFKYHTELCGIPSWFVDKLEEFIWREEALPIDQHELVALEAPRPVCIGTATLDIAADPKGEFLSALNASAVYRLFGSKGLPIAEMPAPDVDVSGDVSFHCHTGKHDQTMADWEHYFTLADKYFKCRRILQKPKI